MFTGLIQDVGAVTALARSDQGAEISIESSPIAQLLELGDSVAVDGVCLTATSTSSSNFAVQAMNQTLSLTTLGQLREGSKVNLEPAARFGDRIGGHIVQGHVDGLGEVVRQRRDGFATRLSVQAPPDLMRYVILHGSICLNGVSLTVAGLGEHDVEVSLIPETLERTNLGELHEGDKVNVECDQVGRYVERLLEPHRPAGLSESEQEDDPRR